MNYTQSDYERDLAIVKNAPEGATHYASKNSKGEVVLYYKWAKLDQYSTWLEKSGKWSNLYRPIDVIFNVSQLNTSIAQYETIEKIKEKIKTSSDDDLHSELMLILFPCENIL